MLYVTGNHVFRSTNEGQSWEEVSPDLTRNDVTKFESSGGPLTQDNTGAEYYGTIFAFAESPIEKGLLWAGSDDGLVHISRDNGKSWRNVTPSALPEWTLISIIEASPHDAATAYIAATRYKFDDFSPYLFKTNDYGVSWTRITTGLPNHVYTRAIREDPTRRGLLYAGTETGVFVSFDDGANWQALKGNLPVVPIHDLVVREPEGDLVLATHGRSFWILDDLGPLRAITSETAEQAAFLVKPRPVVRYMVNTGFSHKAARGKNYRMVGAIMVTFRQTEDPRTGAKVDNYLDAGKNPPNGAIIHYFLDDKPEADISMTFLTADGQEVRTLSSRDPEEAAQTEKGNEKDKEARKLKDPRIPKEVGLNRFVWNLRYADATKIEDDEVANDLVEGGISGPGVPPGTYKVRLQVGEQQFEQEFEVRKDPRAETTDAELRAQFELLKQVHEKLSETHKAINELRAIRRRAEDWAARAKDKPELGGSREGCAKRCRPAQADRSRVDSG